ncbi:MAG: hypothetical protein JXQ87_09770 [Bacteroidia bacterium]
MYRLILLPILLTFLTGICSCLVKPPEPTLVPLTTITYGIPVSIKKLDSSNASKWQLIERKVNDSYSKKLKQVIVKSRNAVQSQCSSLFNFINEIKRKVVESDNDQTIEEFSETGRVLDHRNIDVTENVLFSKSRYGMSLADSLQQEINLTRKGIVNQLKIIQGDSYDETKGEVYFSLRANDCVKNGQPLSWSKCTFSKIPRGAAVALLTKYQYDVKSAEDEFLTQTLKFLYNN